MLNLESVKPELWKTKQWSEYVTNCVENILTENEIVYFTPVFKVRSHYFGNVEVLMRTGKVIDLRNTIITLQYGLLIDNLTEFSQGSQFYSSLSLSLQLTIIPIWFSDNFRTNKEPHHKLQPF